MRSHPILRNGEEVAYVVIDVDPRFITKRFRDVFLDTGVVVLVSVLLSFEVLVLLSSRSLTAPLDRLQRLAAMQALGDFSMRAAVGARADVGRMTSLLSRRAETRHPPVHSASSRTSQGSSELWRVRNTSWRWPRTILRMVWRERPVVRAIALREMPCAARARICC